MQLGGCCSETTQSVACEARRIGEQASMRSEHWSLLPIVRPNGKCYVGLNPSSQSTYPSQSTGRRSRNVQPNSPSFKQSHLISLEKSIENGSGAQAPQSIYRGMEAHKVLRVSRQANQSKLLERVLRLRRSKIPAHGGSPQEVFNHTNMSRGSPGNPNGTLIRRRIRSSEPTITSL